MSQNIGEYTNTILNEFLAATGKTDAKSLITPEEYLIFRQQAINEVKQGFYIIDNAAAQTYSPEGKSDSVNNMNTTEKLPKKPQETLVVNEPIKKPKKDEPQLIPMTPQKTKTTEEELLSIMRSIEC